jgi:KaiC/GvpD/RAD55 family RecA-like ATPase
LSVEKDSEIPTVCIPEEVVDFYSKEGGRSLLIKGGAGTGKTTFALQLLEEFSKPENSYYISTRVSDESLYNQFPWLKSKEMRSRIIDSSRDFLKALYQETEEAEGAPKEVNQKVAGAREFLKSLQKGASATAVDRTQLQLLMQEFDYGELLEVRRLYDRIEEKLPETTLCVVDSVEGITNKYKINPDTLIMAMQKDLVENSGTNLLFVMEFADDTSIDYLVDGVVTVSRDEIEGRRVREIHLHKLRATEIKQPKYLLTLQNGRFRAFKPFNPQITKPVQWNPLTDDEEKYSTGTPALDTLLSGGFTKGSYNVIEVGNDVSTEEYYSILRPILLNFLGHGRGAIAVLTGGEHADALRNDLVRFMDPGAFNRLMHIADYFIQKVDDSKPYIMPLGTRNKEEAIRIWQSVYKQLRGAEGRPIMDFAGFDTLEYLRGGDVAIKDLFDTVGGIKISQDLGIGILKPGLKMKQEIMNMADTYFKIIDINKSCCIYGVKPHTIIYVITPDDEKGYPHVKFTPIV